ncbi:MAG: transporter substrate-binding domain-containing protein [Oscillospiraceae bacterium]|nr:transporter substrate-binding domain-containing protein [Oscillospiraceae bacterium]
MLSIVLSVILVVGIVGIFTACGDKGTDDTANGGEDTTAAASDLAYIKEKGTMIIGITEYAPMNYKAEDGSWTGFDTEFAEAVCEKLGVKAEFFVLSDWDQKVNELNAKTIDVVWNGMTIKDELKQSMSITDAYVYNAQVIVTKAENADKYKDLNSIKDATIAVETGSAGQDMVKDCANVTEVAAQSDALLEVQSGAADVCVIDITMADAMTGKGTSYADLQKTGTLSEEEYGIGCRLGSDTCAEINKIIAELKEDGTLDALAKKYELTLVK